MCISDEEFQGNSVNFLEYLDLGNFCLFLYLAIFGDIWLFCDSCPPTCQWGTSDSEAAKYRSRQSIDTHVVKFACEGKKKV